MAPTCPQDSRNDDAKNSADSISPDRAVDVLKLLDTESEPFYGMFDRHSDETESDWAEIRRLASPRYSIPEASETFQRVMRQLDGIEDLEGRSSATDLTAESQSSDKRERKASSIVKKSGSFSAPDCRSSSSASSKEAAAMAAEAKRRRSVPCMPGEKHVQWADEAGVSDLVSVRLIRPRLAKSDKEEANVSVPRSILRRLTGIH